MSSSKPLRSPGTLPSNLSSNPYVTSSAAANVYAGINKTSTELRITDDMDLKFSDGSTVTGKEFRTYMKILRKLAIADYPEELI